MVCTTEVCETEVCDTEVSEAVLDSVDWLVVWEDVAVLLWPETVVLETLFTSEDEESVCEVT